MYKFTVLTDPDTAVGFRMAGVETREAGNAEEARRLLPGLLQEEDAGIIAVSEEFMQGLDERLMTRIERSSRPIVIPIPGRSRQGGGMAYIERLLRRAIGHNIVLRR
ncbi:MAG TPA: V-type ATP synthase subunit F [Methanoregulaceae archaeon]|nr:V-type ATP synthase subunit F [Methanoregulaceae archaeon]